jgi:hypothetical protein
MDAAVTVRVLMAVPAAVHVGVAASATVKMSSVVWVLSPAA